MCITTNLSCAVLLQAQKIVCYCVIELEYFCCRETHQHWHRVDEGRELLGKVFTSWQSRSGKPSAPVSTTAIATLKKTARLLHYITSPLLLRQSAVAPPDTQVT